ncbi:MAG: cyclic nucleotide-binding domain-containing protein [Anaerolineales bacterium]|nr:cyclic nucleotide-binding domain-containing protein [Anaerolineales bacterium]
MTNISHALKQISLFAGLSDEMIAQLSTKIVEQQIPAGTTLFREGDPGDALYFIVEGQLEISQLLGADKEVVLGVFQAGDYFGEMSLLDEKPRSATARAQTDSCLLALAKDDFDSLLDTHPALARKLTKAISNRLRTTSPMKTRAIPQEAEEKAPAEGPEVRVFISYSRKDKAFVQKLNEAVVKMGMDTWVDWENIPLTVDWWAEIQRGIDNADAFAFVISPDSLNSRVCNDEIQAAVEGHKRLIPILHREPEPQGTIHPAIGATNWVYMRSDQEMTTHIPEMVRIIRLDLEWVQTHTRLLIRAGEWANARRDNSFLLRGVDLEKAEQWLAKAENIPDPKPSPLHQDYIYASRQDTLRRRNLTFAGLATGLVILSLLLLTFIGFNNANVNAQRAIEQLNLASTAQVEAENQKAEADTQRGIAETQRADADVQRINAEGLRATAQAESELRATAQADAFFQRDLALSRQQAAQALSFINTQPDLAALLSVEAYQSSDTLEARNALLTVLQQSLTREIVPLVPEIPTQLSGIYGITFSPDGKYLAFSQQNGTIIVWNVATGSLERSFSGHEGKRIWSLAFSPDGKMLASGGDDSAVYLWDIATGTPTARLDTSNLALSVAWSPDGTEVAAAAGPRVIVWNILEDVRRETSLVFVINQLAWSPDGQKIAAANRDTVVYLLDSQTLDTLQTLRGHIGDAQSVAWAPDSTLLASGGIDARILLWDTRTGTQVAELTMHQGIVYGLAFSYDGKILASGSQDRQLLLWNVETRSFLTTVKTFGRDVQGVAMTPNAGKIYLAAGGLDKNISVYEIQLDQPLSEKLAAEVGKVAGLAISSEGTLTTFSQQGGTSVELFETDQVSFNVAQSLKKLTVGEISSLALSPDAKITLIGQQNGRIVLTHLETNETLNFTRPEPATALAFRPDNLQFASSHCLTYQTETLSPQCINAEVQIWDLENKTPAQTLTGFSSNITALAYSPEGHILATGHEDQTILLWDLNLGEQIGIPLVGQQAPLTSLAFSPEGTLLASGSADNTIILWDLRSAQPLGDPLTGSAEGVLSLTFQQDGKVLFLGTGDGNVYRWEVDTQLWKNLACGLAGRNLTTDEWALFFIGEVYRTTCEQYPPGE